MTRGSCLMEAFLWSLAVAGVILTVLNFIGLLIISWITESLPLQPLFPLLLFILPGLIYTIWRGTSKYDVCPECNHPTMIPVDTPEGQRLLAEQQKHIARTDSEVEDQ